MTLWKRTVSLFVPEETVLVIFLGEDKHEITEEGNQLFIPGNDELTVFVPLDDNLIFCPSEDGVVFVLAEGDNIVTLMEGDDGVVPKGGQHCHYSGEEQ